MTDYERAYFERGMFAAYAWMITKKRGDQLSDAVVDHAWEHRDEGMGPTECLPTRPSPSPAIDRNIHGEPIADVPLTPYADADPSPAIVKEAGEVERDVSLLEAAQDLLDARERLGPAAMERHDLWRCLADIVAEARS